MSNPLPNACSYLDQKMAELRDEFRAMPDDQRKALGVFLADQGGILGGTNVAGAQWTGVACLLMSTQLAVWQQELKAGGAR